MPLHILFRLVSGILAIRRHAGKLGTRGSHVGPFPHQIIGNRAAQTGIGDVVRGVGGLRHIAAGDLVLALGAGLDAGELMGDRVVDGLIVAQLEMQKGMMLDGAPVAAEQRVRADEINGAGNSPRRILAKILFGS